MRLVRQLLVTASALSLICVVGGAPADADSTLRAVMHSDLKILDPIWTTAYIVRNHGYMVYDTLFATDAKGEIKPQMVDKYEVSGRQAHLHLHPARRPRSGTTASRSPPRTASPRSSAGPPRTPWARS